jgi:hypothetical protein
MPGMARRRPSSRVLREGRSAVVLRLLIGCVGHAACDTLGIQRWSDGSALGKRQPWSSE